MKLLVSTICITVSILFSINSSANLKGAFVGSANINKKFILDSRVRNIYSQYSTRSNFKLTSDFKEIVNKIERFIKKKSKKNSAKRNGFSHRKLAQKITLSSFCLGMDPYIETGKLYFETKFDRRAISHSGAVGFSQMTSIGIDEVNDQLGNKGTRYAPAKNIKYFKGVVRCKFGKSWKNMWQAGVLPKGRSSKGRKAPKAWLRSSADRDLTYGGILLKTMMAGKFKGKANRAFFKRALEEYNGETVRYKGMPLKRYYAIQVLKAYDQMRK